MKHYRAVLTVKPHLADEELHESTIPLHRMVMEFGIGDELRNQNPEDVVKKNMKDLHIGYYMDYSIERTSGPEPDGFDGWLSRQPYGGPSKTPGKRLITESTINLMRKAWNAAVATTELRIRKKNAALPFSPEQEIEDMQLRGL